MKNITKRTVVSICMVALMLGVVSIGVRVIDPPIPSASAQVRVIDPPIPRN